MTNPSFTIIIPTLNEGLYISHLLQDLVDQSYKDFQIYIVDANSSDDTQKKAHEFKSRLNLKIITSSKKNVSFQRNHGASKSKSDWLIFFDADIRIGKDFLRDNINNLKTNSPDAFSNFISSDTNDPRDQAIANFWNLSAYTLSALKRPTAFGACIGVKTSVFKILNGFDSSIKFQEDQDFVQRLTKNNFNFTIFTHPRYYHSFRRFRKEGSLKLLRKFALLFITKHFPTLSLQQKDLYPMQGGSYYESSKSTVSNFDPKKLTKEQVKKIEDFVNSITKRHT